MSVIAITLKTPNPKLTLATKETRLPLHCAAGMRRAPMMELGNGSVEKNRDPVRPRRIRRIARVAGAYRKLL